MSAVTRANSAVLLCYLPLRFEFVGNNSATKRDLDRVAILPEINMVNSLLFLPAFFVLSIRPYKKRVKYKKPPGSRGFFVMVELKGIEPMTS